MTGELIASVILSWNSRENTLECLRSNYEADFPKLLNIVVDQGSNDGTVEAIKEKFPETIIIENEKNLGHSLGNNQGIQCSIDNGAKYVFLQDNDTIVHKDMYINLLREFEHEESVGIVGPLVLYAEPDNKIWCGGGMINRHSFRHIHLNENEIYNGNTLKRKTVDFMPSCGILVKKEVFEKIGRFDEGLFLYHNDVDFCLRAKRVGYDVVFQPDAKMWHKVSASVKPYSPMMIYYKGRNKLILFKRYGKLRNIPFFAGFHLKKALTILYSKKDFKSFTAIFKAIFGYLRFSKNK